MNFDVNRARDELKRLKNIYKSTYYRLGQYNKLHLKTYYLTQNTINPMLISSRWTIKDAFIENQKVRLADSGDILEFYNKEDIKEFKEKESVVFWFNGQYFLISKCNEFNKYKKHENHRKKLRDREKQLGIDIETISYDIKKYEFWKDYEIPFSFTVDIKKVLSGLMKNSNGDGKNKASVTHLVAQEDIKFGKLKRAKYEYICTQPDAYGHSDWNLDKQQKLKDIVTCKSCLKTMQRWKIN